MASVLLTDGQQRKTLAATRALGRQGYRVLVADETRCSTAGCSRYCHQGLVSPPPRATAAYWQWLTHTRRRYGPDVLVPMDDDTTTLAVARQPGLPFQTLLPTPEQYAAGRDKAQTAALAERAGVAAPATVAVASEAEALAAAARCGWSAVMKARQASGGRGLFFVNGPETVRAAWARSRREWGGFLVQQRIGTGRKFDVCLLFDANGGLRAHFVQQELRWFPLEYGASTLQESVHRPDLVQLARQLLAPIGWRGPVEVEFMEDAAGEPVLMEVNPRYWASLALAIRCGVDFPSLHVALALGDEASGPAAYPAGLRCRWLLPGDLLHFLVNPRRRQVQPGFFATYDHRTVDDIWERSDPWPVFGFASAVLRYLWVPNMWRMLFRW